MAKRPRESWKDFTAHNGWLDRNHIGVQIVELRWDAFQRLIESAMAAKGTVMGDQVVYATHIQFSLSKRSEVEIAREVFLFIPICGLEEQAVTMERRTHGSRHGDLLNIGEGSNGCKWSGQRQNGPVDKWNHLVELATVYQGWNYPVCPVPNVSDAYFCKNPSASSGGFHESGRLRLHRYFPNSPRVFYTFIAIRTLATVLMAV
jgi:hypothetical protein